MFGADVVDKRFKHEIGIRAIGNDSFDFPNLYDVRNVDAQWNRVGKEKNAAKMYFAHRQAQGSDGECVPSCVDTTKSHVRQSNHGHFPGDSLQLATPFASSDSNEDA